MREKFEGATPPQEIKEKMQKPVTFHVAEHGLDTSISEVMSDKEFKEHTNPLPDGRLKTDNRNWYAVTVASEEGKKKWINLRNEYLSCAWTPNQDTNERSKNADRMREIEKEMRELENKARGE